MSDVITSPHSQHLNNSEMLANYYSQPVDAFPQIDLVVRPWVIKCFPLWPKGVSGGAGPIMFAPSWAPALLGGQDSAQFHSPFT